MSETAAALSTRPSNRHRTNTAARDRRLSLRRNRAVAAQTGRSKACRKCANPIGPGLAWHPLFTLDENGTTCANAHLTRTMIARFRLLILLFALPFMVSWPARAETETT